MLTDTVRCLKKRHAKHGMNKSTSASASAFSRGNLRHHTAQGLLPMEPEHVKGSWHQSNMAHAVV